jgi:CBS domain-containing protein
VALMNSAIFFDFRPLAGEASLAQRLREFLLGTVARRPAFLRQMAANALETRPPLGALGDFVTDDGGHIDLKLHGSRPFVDAARVLALAHGVAETSTAGRLLQAAPAARLGPEQARSAIDAFHFVQMLRLRNQDFFARSGAAGGNRVEAASLSALDARILKESFRQARKLQNALAADYAL